jgi:peptide/nickel transport system permease protein
MTSYIIRRVLIAIPLLLGMTFLAFMVIQLGGGEYFAELRLNPQISRETIEQIERQFNLDKPVVVQYVYWLKNVLKLDFGYSFSRMASVSGLIWDRLPATLLLSISSILVTWLVAIPLGIYCAVHRYSWGDRFASFFAYIGISIPNFFLALLLLYLASVAGVLPLGGMKSADYDSLSTIGRVLDVGKHLIIPTVVIATAAMAGLQRLMRGNMLEVLRAQYITTARAKGLPENRVIYVHALRNAINPMISIFGLQFSSLLGGAALTEIVTSWPGLGSLMLEAVRSRDLYLVMGDLLIGGTLLIAGNLLADVLLAWTDPRIRLE